MYLAASGVGTIGVCDDDVVDESNLLRQIVHKYPVRINEENIDEIIREYDFVVDAVDTFGAKLCIACDV